MTTIEKMNFVDAMLKRMNANRKRATKKYGYLYGVVKYHEKEARLNKCFSRLLSDFAKEMEEFEKERSCFN